MVFNLVSLAGFLYIISIVQCFYSVFPPHTKVSLYLSRIEAHKMCTYQTMKSPYIWETIDRLTLTLTHDKWWQFRFKLFFSFVFFSFFHSRFNSTPSTCLMHIMISVTTVEMWIEIRIVLFFLFFSFLYWFIIFSVLHMCPEHFGSVFQSYEFLLWFA